MVGRHHRFNEHEFEQITGDSEGQEAWHAAVHCVTKSWSRLSEQQLLFPSGSQSTGTSALTSVLPMNIQD